MNTSSIIIVVLVAILIVALIAAIIRVGAQRQLRQRFGDEYDRVVDEKGGRRAAAAELRRRQRSHAALELRDLTPEQIEGYRSRWSAAQARFIDDPVGAVRDAGELVTLVVTDRGYPAGDYDDRLSHLSVEHAPALPHYRAAHDVGERNDAGQATTEELRQAMVDYRATIDHLLGEGSLPAAANPSGADPGWAATSGDPATGPRNGNAPSADPRTAGEAALTEEDERVLAPSEQVEASEAPRRPGD